jgi:hypothetical protein
MEGLLTDVRAALQAPIRHTYHAHKEEQQPQQQQWQPEERDLAANSTQATAAPDVAAAAAAANAPEHAARCDPIICPMQTEQAVLLVIEVLPAVTAAAGCCV